MSTILVIDDDRALCRSLAIQLGGSGHEVRSAGTAAEGLAEYRQWAPDIVLLDLRLPDRSGLEILGDLGKEEHAAPVVMITGQSETRAAIEAMRSGAFDYIRKPLDLDEVELVLEKARRLPRAGEARRAGPEDGEEGPYEIVGEDRQVLEVVKRIGLLSRSRITVVIEGESGTGKELAARALHEAGSSGEPFVAVNCSALVPTLLESELFGHEKGAFTGAAARKTGRLEHAGEGTLFLDEIGDMPLELQARILRVLQEREFERVGGLEPIPFRARVVSATNQDLERLAGEGRFRQDLYHRLSVARLVLPPLRRRRGDIPLLARHLLRRIAGRIHRRVEDLEEEALRRLSNYDWPGNVRELENVLTRAAALARGPVIAAAELEFSFGGTAGAGSAAGAAGTGLGVEAAAGSGRIVPLEEAVKEHVRKALAATGWNITRTAALLRISPTTLRKKIADLGLKAGE